MSKRDLNLMALFFLKKWANQMVFDSTLDQVESGQRRQPLWASTLSWNSSTTDSNVPTWITLNEHCQRAEGLCISSRGWITRPSVRFGGLRYGNDITTVTSRCVWVCESACAPHTEVRAGAKSIKSFPYRLSPLGSSRSSLSMRVCVPGVWVWDQ